MLLSVKSLPHAFNPCKRDKPRRCTSAAFEEAGEAIGLALVPATLMRIAAAEIEGMHAGLFEH
jgi:hypothetical protein